MLETVAKDHDLIVAFIELISPVLVARARRNTAPSLWVNILVVLPSNDSFIVKTIQEWYRAAATTVTSRYHDLVHGKGSADTFALVASRSTYDFLDRALRYDKALHEYIKEHFKLSIVFPEQLWRLEIDNSYPFITSNASASSLALPCRHIQWHNGDL